MSHIGTLVRAIQLSAISSYGSSIGGWETYAAWSVLLVSVLSCSGNRKTDKALLRSAEPCKRAAGFGGRSVPASIEQTRIVAIL